MGTPEWQWWKELEATEKAARRQSWQAAWNGQAGRWIVLAGFGVLAVFKFARGAWVFGLGYLACAVGFFVAYSIEASRRRKRPEP